jgi:hypothetical protein
MKRTKGPRRGHGPGKGSVFISCTIPEEFDAELRRLAAASNLTRAGMARECIQDAVARGLTITTQKSHAGKIIDYPLDHPGNPTARAADDAGA